MNQLPNKNSPNTNKLKQVCYVVTGFPKVSETFIAEEALSLADFEVDCHILALMRGNFQLVHQSAQALIDQNIITYLDPPTKSQSLLALCYLLIKKPNAAFKTLLKALKHPLRWRYFQCLPFAQQLINDSVNYLHAHFADDNLRVAAILSEWTDIPFGFTAHRYDIFDDPLPVEEFTSLANNAHAIVTVSEYNKQVMLKRYQLKSEQVYVAYNGIRTELFQPKHQADADKKLRLLNVGRLVPIKGQDLLLHALKKVCDQGHSVHLRIIGEGPERETLESLIQRLGLQNYVELLGAQPQETVCEYLNKTDVFVMPSRSEGFAVACLEAMAMELPVIASNVTGFPEAITDYKTGILVGLENIDQLAEAIIWMIEHPEQRLTIGKQGRETVLARFTREKVTAGLIDYWQKSIQKKV